MKLDTTVIKGNLDKAAFIFIHGLGMDKRIWESPDAARVLGGRFPISLLLCREPHVDVKARGLFIPRPSENLTTLFHDLREQGYTVVTWSQKRPAAETDIAVSEFKKVLNAVEPYCKSGIVLIGHSRGGLIARKYLACGDKRVKALVTLATPHQGSSMARWAEYLSPLSSFISPMLSDAEKGTLTYTAKKILDFLASKAVKELLPDSLFFKNLDERRLDRTYYISAGGKDPDLICVYRNKAGKVHKCGQEMPTHTYTRVISIPGALESIIPARLFPDEMRKGRGDGLVSAESSKLLYGDEHYDFDVNHAEILFDKKIRTKVMASLSRLL